MCVHLRRLVKKNTVRLTFLKFLLVRNSLAMSCENKDYNNVLCAIMYYVLYALLNMKHKSFFFFQNRLSVHDKNPDNDVIVPD
jgi:hypothetical protein